MHTYITFIVRTCLTGKGCFKKYEQNKKFQKKLKQSQDMKDGNWLEGNGLSGVIYLSLKKGEHCYSIYQQCSEKNYE